MKWYKMYINSIRDVKFRKLKKQNPEKFPFLWTLWCMMLDEAAQSGGVFKYDGTDDLDVMFDVIEEATSSTELGEFIEQLMSVDLIIWSPTEIKIKNWEKYQHASLSTPRVQEHRENKQMEDDVTSVITSLNEIVGKNFRVKTETYRKAIRGRFNDGYTKENMLAVIRHKFNTWHNDPKMKKFLTPETLFRPGNFDRYLQEIPEGHVEAMGTGKLLHVENIYGHKAHITQEQYKQAEPDFWHIVK